MEKSSVFTSPRVALVVSTALLFILCGCAPSSEPINDATAGWFNHFFVYYFSRSITYFGDLFGGNYGLSIILLTVSLRLLLMPLMWKQNKAGRAMQGKMQVLQPELEELKNKYKDRKDPKSQSEMQQEMMHLYQHHQFNPLSIGCLPMLVQLPFLMGFYYAISRTSEIAAHGFLWFNLGQPDLLLPLIAAGIYYLQVKIGQKTAAASPTQPNGMKYLLYLSPIMIGLVSFNTPAVMPLYWAVGGLFLIGQSLLFHRLNHQ